MGIVVDLLFILAIVVAVASVAVLFLVDAGIAAYLMMMALFLMSSAVMLTIYEGHGK